MGTIQGCLHEPTPHLLRMPVLIVYCAYFTQFLALLYIMHFRDSTTPWFCALRMHVTIQVLVKRLSHKEKKKSHDLCSTNAYLSKRANETVES